MDSLYLNRINNLLSELNTNKQQEFNDENALIEKLTSNHKKQCNNNLLSKRSSDISDPFNCYLKAYYLTAYAKLNGILSYVKMLKEKQRKYILFAYHLFVLDEIEKIFKFPIINDSNSNRDFKYNYIRIDDSILFEKQVELINVFNTDDNCLYAIISITTCYKGISFNSCCDVVFCEMFDVPTILCKAEDRCKCLGKDNNMKSINVTYLYGENTLDHQIYMKLKEKDQMDEPISLNKNNSDKENQNVKRFDNISEKKLNVKDVNIHESNCKRSLLVKPNDNQLNLRIRMEDKEIKIESELINYKK